MYRWMVQIVDSFNNAKRPDLALTALAMCLLAMLLLAFIAAKPIGGLTSGVRQRANSSETTGAAHQRPSTS